MGDEFCILNMQNMRQITFTKNEIFPQHPEVLIHESLSSLESLR